MTAGKDAARIIKAAFAPGARPRLIFGAGCVAQAGRLAGELGARRVLLVTDPGVARAGHAARVAALLAAPGRTLSIFDGVRENPTTKDVAACVEAARAGEADLLVGLGGGSALDTAKGCNFLLTNGGRMADYWGVGKATRPMLPFLAIPTTAGTGSECQSAALIADEVTHQKMACLDKKATAFAALLDPELTFSQPPRVTASTGLDAVAHAVESAVTRKRNPVSAAFAQEAFRLCFGAFPRVLAHPGDLAARGDMLLGAALAGLAIENSMLGAAHSAANPLTAHFQIAHGLAVGLMLPHVVRFNLAHGEAEPAYRDLAAAAGLAASQLPECLAGLLTAASLPSRLRDWGVTEDSLHQLASEAATQWTAQFNPAPVAAGDFLSLYRQAF